jgi:predicted RNase H-like nuclease
MEVGETSEHYDNEQNIYFILVFPKEQNVDFNKLKIISKKQKRNLNRKLYMKRKLKRIMNLLLSIRFLN